MLTLTSIGHTIFLVSFLLAELPSQLVSKKLGPDRWIPMQMVLWSIVAASQAALSGRSSFYATRALIGVLEGGFIPDLVLWLSYFYTSSELPLRLSFFWTSLDITSIVTALMAYGLLQMNGVHGLAGWRWLFLIEGLITLAVGIASFFLMPASAVSTKTWFRPNGWFKDREVGIVVNRVLRDDPSKGDMHNRMAITPSRLWRALCEPAEDSPTLAQEAPRTRSDCSCSDLQRKISSLSCRMSIAGKASPSCPVVKLPSKASEGIIDHSSKRTPPGHVM